MAEASSLKLPNANEFSPTLITDGLLGALRRIQPLQGDKSALVAALRTAYISRPENDPKFQRARNILIGMSQYGLYELGTETLTELGSRLSRIPNEQSAREAFAKHILQNCHGIALVEAAEAIRQRNETPNKSKINDELRLRGFSVTTNSGDAAKLRMWLEPTGVIQGEDYRVDPDAFARLAGAGITELDEWSQMTRSQRALLLTLKRLSETHGTDWIDGPYVKELCQSAYHPKILPEGDLRGHVLDPLEETGWIRTQGKGPGRGGKLGKLASTEKLIKISLPLKLENDVHLGVPPDLRAKQNTPLQKIHEDLQSRNTHTKGVALELLALRMCIDLGLVPVKYRLRSRQVTGQAEVDLIAEGIHLHFSRWLIQCKNYPRTAVDLTALAKEVGLAVLLRGHVVVIVTTGTFTRSVNEHAQSVGETTPLQVVLVDGKAIDDYQRHGPGKLLDHFRQNASEVMRLKRHQITEVLRTEGD